MADRFITVARDSRYKDTPVFSEGGKPEFGLWEPPPEFDKLAPGTKTHVVSSFEVGFLDLLAVRYYGPGHEHLFWVIAQANAIADPEKEMYPGQTLTIPARSAVVQFQSRQGNVTS